MSSKTSDRFPSLDEDYLSAKHIKLKSILRCIHEEITALELGFI
jgi:hypothetical protein